MSESITELFEMIPGSFALIQSKGSYTPKVLYTYNKHLYFAYGQGFVRLRPMNKTSKDNMFWNELHLPAGEYETKGIDLFWINPSLSVVGK